jgi:signal transduction histidine kinase/CheY-like chemotaxis protein
MLYDFMVRKEFNTKDNLLESKRKFVRFISHEVRTPLNSVAMGISLLQDECANTLGHKSAHEMLKREGSQGNLLKLADAATKQDDVWKDTVSEWFYLLQDIQNNAQSSVDVLNDLLNYDKVETGSLSLELTVIPIWKLIEKTVNEFALPLAKKKIEFDLLFTDIAASDWKRNKAISSCPQTTFLSKECRNRKVVGDVVRLTQVLRNLFSNAVKFTKEGGKIKINVSSRISHGQKEKKFVLKCGTEVAAVDSGHLQVKVSDSGAGMTKKQLSLLFRHGVQFNVNELQAGQGSGLGLFIAKGILEEHQGLLYADSEGLGMGSTFTLELPMYTIQGFSEDISQNDKTENCSSSTEPAGFRILVVDDSAPNRKLLARILTNKGHQVDIAKDGSMAVAKVSEAILESNQYDTILLDYEMPVMNGPDAAKAIRAMGCDVFIVGVTGNMLAEDVAHFRSCGANTLLEKPFKMKSLEEAWMEHGITQHKTIEDRV